MQTPCDEQLVKSALAGDDEAFTELVNRYQGRLLRFLQSRCTCRADAEDALQEALVNAYRYLPSFNPRWRFSTWLYRIALRQAARQRSAPLAESTDALAAPDDPLKACIAAGERENLWSIARRRLSDAAYAALWLHYVEGLPLKEIAAVLDRSLAWVKVTLFRARRVLRKELANEDEACGKGEIYG